VGKENEAGVTGKVINVINMQASERRQLFLKIPSTGKALVELGS
jgi:hypothetical protein